MNAGDRLFKIHASSGLVDQHPFRKASRGSIVNLSSNELLHPDFTRVYRSFLNQYRLRSDFSHYPSVSDGAVLLEKHLKLSRGSVALVPGADPGIRATLEALGASGRLVMPVPCYRAYLEYTHALGMKFHGVGVLLVSEEEFVNRMLSAIREHAPCLVAVANPDGFTGRAWSDRVMRDIAIACKEYDALLLIDEAYVAFRSDGGGSVGEGAQENVLTIRTLSKSHGAAGTRLAYLFGAEDLVAQVAKTRVSNGLSSIALAYMEYAVHEHLAFERLASEIVAWRNSFVNQLRERRPEWRVPSSHGNFAFFDTLESGVAETVHKKLATAGIRIRMFPEDAAFATSARITIACHETMARVLECI